MRTDPNRIAQSVCKLATIIVWACLPIDIINAQHFGAFAGGDSHTLSNAAGHHDFNVSEVLDAISSESVQPPIDLGEPWWTAHAAGSMDDRQNPVYASVNDLLQMAMQHAAQIQVYKKTPMIRSTAVQEAASAFDWSQFIDSMWEDVSEPVGSSLTVGPGGNRFQDHNLSVNAGVRKRTYSGGSLEMSQRFGHQNTNSQFFLPNNQGTARLVLGFTQPLLRGHGKTYNTSLVVLANIDVGRSKDEYCRQLQQHLLEVARGYWTMYLARAGLAQKISLYLKTGVNAERLERRRMLDASGAQLIQVQAALESRRSDLIRARSEVKNAETRLRALINAPHLTEYEEIIPNEHPTVFKVDVDLYDEFATAVKHRPEIAASLKEIRAACVRLKMAKHELLPVLNLVTNTYLAGLKGNSRVGDAWTQQFSDGAPSYSVGLEFELPIGRRAANAAYSRRQIEISQLRDKYRSTLELIRAEVEVAVREVETSYRELIAKDRARRAAEVEAQAIETRWIKLAGADSTGSQVLDGLLRAQERLASDEYEFARAQLTYSLSLINLRHANGTLMSCETGRDCQPAQYADQAPVAPELNAAVAERAPVTAEQVELPWHNAQPAARVSEATTPHSRRHLDSWSGRE